MSEQFISSHMQMTESRLQAILEALQVIVSNERISITASDRQQHARDQSSHEARLPDIVIWPTSTAEVSAIMQAANEAGIPVTAWGAGTSLEGNPIPVFGGIVLNFQQMNQILEIHDQDFQVTVQPGIFYKDMNKVLARYGLFFAPDPGANASIGGMVANNAAGIRTVKYGATRDNVLALEVVLADGRVIRTGSRSVKQSAGYDLTHLFVGSEGTLGIVTAATLKLAPLPEHFSAVIAAFPSIEVAAQVVFEIIGSGLEPTALELLNTTTVSVLNTADTVELVEAPHLLMEFSSFSVDSLREVLEVAKSICEANRHLHFETGVGRAERDKLWKIRHEMFEIALRNFPGHTYLISDVAVPISAYPAIITRLVDLMTEQNVDGLIAGHAGDGNVHTLFFFPPDDQDTRARIEEIHHRLVEEALRLAGTSTGEHGVGLGKQKYMAQEHGQAALEVMQQLKAVLDPNGILNPGKVLGLQPSKRTNGPANHHQ